MKTTTKQTEYKFATITINYERKQKDFVVEQKYAEMAIALNRLHELIKLGEKYKEENK